MERRERKRERERGLKRSVMERERKNIYRIYKMKDINSIFKESMEMCKEKRIKTVWIEDIINIFLVY